MPLAAKTKANSAAPRKTTRQPARVLYLYAVSRMPERRAPAITSEGIDGVSAVEALRSGKYLAWISRVAREDFADHLTQRMQDLDWLAAAGLRHQRVVAEIAQKLPALPARFGTVFLNEASLAKHIAERSRALDTAFTRSADADEWGVKVFAVHSPRAPRIDAASSGADYLKQKAELRRPRSAARDDPEVREFAAALKKLAVADAPGGKASAGQPGLTWHGSFLIRRKDRGKLEALLGKYAAAWSGVRRIDCSGPWPPYSFVGEHV
jgi:Gas vesicle synthesis protein GvpL/GvpF